MSYQTVNPNSNLALWQASGIGAYDHVGDYGWEFFPAPYDFEAPLDSQPIRPPILGMGCGGSCGCGGTCSDNHGLGQGLFNTGLFTSTDPTQWGVGEWATIAAAVYLGSSIFGDAKTAGRKVRSGYNAARRAS